MRLDKGREPLLQAIYFGDHSQPFTLQRRSKGIMQEEESMKFMHAAKYVCACRETLPLIGAKKAHRINIFVQNSSKLHEFTLILLLFYAKWKKGRKVSSIEESCTNFMQVGRNQHFFTIQRKIIGGFS